MIWLPQRLSLLQCSVKSGHDPHAFSWASASPHGNFEIHVAEKERFASNIILKMCIYTHCKTPTLSKALSFFWLSGRKEENLYPFHQNYFIIFFLTFLSFFIFSYYCFFFFPFSWFLHESGTWITQLLHYRGHSPRLKMFQQVLFTLQTTWTTSL